MKKLAPILFLLFSTIANAQFSKTHYIPPLSNSNSISLDPQGQYLYISCPSITPVNFQIQEIGGGTIAGVVSRDSPYVYTIGFGSDTQLLISQNDVATIKNNKGYIVQADDLIYVTVRLTASSQNNQAGGLVAKGSAALGTHFRIGALTNTNISATNEIHYTFATILATENNTVVSFADIKPGVELINDASSGNTPANVTLNAGESYAIAVVGPNNANRDGLIGASIISNKPIAVNCGSFGGTNGNNPSNLDLGFDQIVSAERTGSEYIFIKGSGLDIVERPLLVANVNNTNIYLNGSTIPVATLNAGQYLSLDGSAFSADGNLYVSSNQNIFAYQGIGGSPSQANQNMHFLPPLSCQTPKIINNIPLIDEVGSLPDFTGTVCLVTKTGATLDFIIDGTNYTLTTLPSNIVVNGPLNVTGNSSYVTYTLKNLKGNVSVFSSEQIYLSYYGSSGNATYGGFYSGFTFNPEIILQPQAAATNNCLPFVDLEINAISGFNSFKWYFNGVLIPGANSNIYTPTQPGFYKVVATLSACGTDFPSPEIPVSACATDTDNDGVNDNIDLDIDNDGITNCNESYGNQSISLANPAAGSITVGAYSNAFTGTVTTSATASTTPFVSSAGGSFVTDIPAGKTNWVEYKLNFAQPVSLGMDYVSTANATDLLNSNAEYSISSPTNKTITVLNPNNQLLIDTNYDGVFESGVTQYSSFEIRFRLNDTTPLAAGTGTFKFLTNLSSSLTFRHKNLSDLTGNKSTFRFYATCVPKDTDGDGIPDQSDFDSDNDGIPDAVESLGSNPLALSHSDTNGDGIDNVFGTGITAIDTDNDGVPDYLDLDSDNDGIHDLDESGFSLPDTNNNGVIDGSNFGTNGLFDTLETAPDSGIIKPTYVLADTDADGIYNAIELDSDNDLCNDVIEAGYLDSNLDGLLGGTAPPTVNANGLVTSGTGYGNPNPDYSIAAPIIITSQPQSISVCELQSITFSVTSAVNGYQWQLSTDSGSTWTTITNNATYSGTATSTLTVSNVSPSMVGYQYRVYLIKNGNTCGLYSSAATLTTYALPVVTTPITLKQCDDDTDGISIFNLTQKNDVISSNYLTETFTYFTTQPGANTNDANFSIGNPLAYTSGNASVYARVVNANGCFRVARIDLIVAVTQIPPGFVIPNQYRCDDYVDAVNDDRDGIATFDFTAITASLMAVLPSNVTVKYYKNQNDFFAETDAAGNSLAIPNPANYRNIGYPNTQTIWARVDSTIDNSCFGFKTFNIVVEALPTAYPVNVNNIIRHCDDDQNGIYGFNTSTINAAILNGQTTANVKYYRANGTPLPSPLPNPFQVNGTETITIRVYNNTTQTGGQPCYDEETLQFIVDDLPEAFAVNANLTTICDDEPNPVDQDGFYNFDTSSFQSTILGSQTGMNVYYFDQNNNPLPSPLPNPFHTLTQNVKVIVENPINTTCTAQVLLPFVVNPTPKIDLQETVVICLPDTQTILDAGILDNSPTSAYHFQWYTNAVLMTGITSPTITVSTPGVYSVEVTNIATGCTRTRVITVTISQIASIQSVDIVDMADINSILVNVNGAGNYEFAIDDVNGPYQSSNFFNNVPMGNHEIYIRDINGCGSLGPIRVHVLGIPHFFTPNGDGYNDYWNVKGTDAQSNHLSIIYIFDRFGKLLKQISATGLGWDGTFNGNLMPADDYWYKIEFEDGRSAKGHFTLKR